MLRRSLLPVHLLAQPLLMPPPQGRMLKLHIANWQLELLLLPLRM